jgi:hypothetical protein
MPPSSTYYCCFMVFLSFFHHFWFISVSFLTLIMVFLSFLSNECDFYSAVYLMFIVHLSKLSVVILAIELVCVGHRRNEVFLSFSHINTALIISQLHYSLFVSSISTLKLIIVCTRLKRIEDKGCLSFNAVFLSHTHGFSILWHGFSGLLTWFF